MTACKHCQAEFVGNMDREWHRVSDPADPNWVWEKRCLTVTEMQVLGMLQDDTGRWYVPAIWYEPLDVPL